MAKALRCPACGHPHPLENYKGQTTFSCESCGQYLKVPGASAPLAATSTSDPKTRIIWKDPDAVLQQPEAEQLQPVGVGADALISTGEHAVQGGKTATLARTRGEEDDVSARPDSKTQSSDSKVLPRAWRGFIWVASLFSGLIVVGIVGQLIGIVDKKGIARILLEDRLMRFVPLIVFIVFWGFASAVIAELLSIGADRLRSRADMGRQSATRA